ncbi:hypothetical protein QIH87_27720 [Bradyrhizobium elkanii]|uniref:hypothetical protein n=1 Tax=Bradyrhizobium elkanii TaxID=29448 RepID=UPI002714D79A|nr:hypothetical protein [Bradyrhizobium elkanii]WLB05946.1 hypothetical protein QIH87_27720 [Bradyrhizobium elkanii]
MKGATLKKEAPVKKEGTSLSFRRWFHERYNEGEIHRKYQLNKPRQLTSVTGGVLVSGGAHVRPVPRQDAAWKIVRAAARLETRTFPKPVGQLAARSAETALNSAAGNHAWCRQLTALSALEGPRESPSRGPSLNLLHGAKT